MKKIRSTLCIVVLVLSACSKQVVQPTVTSAPAAAQKPSLTATNVPPTATSTSFPFTLTPPDPTADPAIFGVIGIGEIQAFALESVANAIFSKTMDRFVFDGRIQGYQVTSVTVFPGNNGLLSEIIFNVKTTDPGWIAEGSTPNADDWINNMCYRFDFFITDTEYQLKNRRLCG